MQRKKILSMVEKKAILLTLTQLSTKLSLTRVLSGNNAIYYLIKSDDNQINFKLLFNKYNKNLMEKIIQIIRFIYDEFGFELKSTDFYHESDCLHAAMMFFNGIVRLRVCDNNNSNATISNTYSFDKFSEHHIIVRTEITDILYKEKDLNIEEKLTLILTRSLIDNIIQELVFTDIVELHSMMKTIESMGTDNIFEDAEKERSLHFSKILSECQD